MKNLPQKTTTGLVNRSHLADWKNWPIKCLEQATAMTVSEAIHAPSPAYGFINQESPTTAKALLTLQIAELVNNLNVGKTMGDLQVAKCVNLILDDAEMRNLKPDDFKVCFTRMIKGHYGKSYDRIDTQIIFEALYLYLEERVLTCEEISLKRHQLIKDGKMAPANPEGL